MFLLEFVELSAANSQSLANQFDFGQSVSCWLPLAMHHLVLLRELLTCRPPKHKLGYKCNFGHLSTFWHSLGAVVGGY